MPLSEFGILSRERHKVAFDQLNVDAIDTTTSYVDKNGIFLHNPPPRCRASAVPTRMIAIQKPFPRQRFLLETAGVGVRGSADRAIEERVIADASLREGENLLSQRAKKIRGGRLRGHRLFAEKDCVLLDSGFETHLPAAIARLLDNRAAGVQIGGSDWCGRARLVDVRNLGNARCTA